MSKLPKFNELNTYHFITTKVWQNIWLFKEERYCQIIIVNLNFYRRKFGFKLIAYAIMPWHLHLILMLSRKWNDISKVMQQFKSHTAKEITSYQETGRRKPSLSPYSQAASEGSPLPGVGNNTGGKGSPPSEVRNKKESLPLSGTGNNAGSKVAMLPASYQWIDKGNVHTPCINRIWQRNFYDFNIYSYEKLEQKVDYVNNNAVKHNLVDDPVDYKYSSTRNYYLDDDSVIKIDWI